MQYPMVNRATIRHIELVKLSDERLLVLCVTSSVVSISARSSWQGRPDDDLRALRSRLLDAALLGRTTAEAAVSLGAMVDALPPPLASFGARVIATLPEMISTDPSTRVVVGGVPNLTRFGDQFGRRP